MIHYSEVYAGDTALKCEIEVTQTGPLELTIQSGEIVTIGQADIVSERPKTAGYSKMEDGRYRQWRKNTRGDFCQAYQFVIKKPMVIKFPNAETLTWAVALFADHKRGKIELWVLYTDNDEIPIAEGYDLEMLLIQPFLIQSGGELPDIRVVRSKPGFPDGYVPNPFQVTKITVQV